MMREPALIFDFGNVVCFFDFLKVWDRLGAGIGLSGPMFRERIEERGYARLLNQFESGHITPEIFAKSLCALGEVAISYQAFVDAWQDIFELNEPVAALIKTLKANDYPVLLGSNTNIIHSAFYTRRFAETLDVLDHLVLSHEVGHMKPRPEFYRACVTAAGAPAAACVFIDDLAENVEGARRSGLTSLLYVDVPTLIGDLTRLGIDVDAPRT
jgi:HAD superfamily hydrolase (TIGR01509 family)